MIGSRTGYGLISDVLGCGRGDIRVDSERSAEQIRRVQRPDRWCCGTVEGDVVNVVGKTDARTDVKQHLVGLGCKGVDMETEQGMTSLSAKMYHTNTTVTNVGRT